MRIGIDARILLLNLTGVGRYTAQLIKSLARVDAENEYVIFHNVLDSIPIRNKNFRFHPAPVPIYEFFKEQMWFTYHTAKLKLDLFHSTLPYPPMVRPFPAILTIHDLNPDQSPGLYQDKKLVRYYKRWRKFASSKVDMILAPSHATRRTAMDMLGISDDRMAVVYHGCDDLMADERRPEFHTGFPYILYVGHLQRWKNVDGLIRVYAKLVKEDGITERLVLVGDKGWFYAELLELARALGVAHLIYFTGHIPDGELVFLYRHAKLFVFPSFLEGFGLPVLEAMHFGTPVVSSNATSLSEIVGDAGLLFDPANESEMRAKVLMAIRDDELRGRMVIKGTARSKEFTWDKTARQTLDLYKKTAAAT